MHKKDRAEAGKQQEGIDDVCAHAIEKAWQVEPH
jgi:hypothetical protein